MTTKTKPTIDLAPRRHRKSNRRESMSTILTDDEIGAIQTQVLADFRRHVQEEGLGTASPASVARAVEAAVLAKLAQQEPIGFMSEQQVPRIQDNEDESGCYLPMRKTPAGNFTLALYTHPAPQQADRQRVPDGWKLVPVEPTIEMLEAMHTENLTFYASEQREAYAAMLAAAPEAPVPRTDLDVTLTRSEVEAIGAFVDEEMSESDEEVVRLMTGGGHSGHGLYAACPDYPEEGAILVKQLPAPEAPAQADACCGNWAAGTSCFADPKINCPRLLPAPEAPAQASAVDEREKELKWLCAEAYQVVASMLNDLGAMETEKANKILDNLSQARFVHDDVLPWPALAQKGGAA